MLRLQTPIEAVRKKLYMMHNIVLFTYNQLLPNRNADATLPENFVEHDRLVHNHGDHLSSEMPDTFRLLTWNVENGYQVEKLKRDVPAFTADICLLQEVPVFAKDEQPMLANDNHHFVYAPSLFIGKKSARYMFDHRGQMTMCNVSFIEQKMLPLKVVSRYNSNGGRGRYSRQVALYTKFKTKKGTLGVYNMHLENLCTPGGRLLQMRELLEFVGKNKDEYVIVAGDFNSIFGKMELMGIAKKAGFLRAKTSRFTCGPLHLDHVFHSENVIVEAKVHPTSSSDHKPIVAQVTLL